MGTAHMLRLVIVTSVPIVGRYLGSTNNTGWKYKADQE
jgi:hypothetical protein